MKFKQIAFTVAISAVTTLAVIWGYGKYVKSSNTVGGQLSGDVPSNYAKQTGLFDGATPPGAVDFTVPAQASTPAVVHIKTKTSAKQASNGLPRVQKNPFGDIFGNDDMFEQFFGKGYGGQQEQKASGSGVLISADGYIVTNNHVVANADVIDVTLPNKKTYKAKVIGTDPSYDLAVIKIEAAGLPYLIYGNSDDVKIGQWVLAIGYPLNLDATVTAGIVSAKARSLGLNKDKTGKAGTGVESFIQTDAAVNMGNSGGALVNTDGQIIGINSAIASPTGYYSGYSYAIPVNIVKKVVDDIIKFGTVQRAYIGIGYAPADDMTDEEKTERKIPITAKGIYVTDVPKDGGAYASGLRAGDEVTKVNNVPVTSGAEMQEQVSRYKPGDKITITYLRGDKETTTDLTMKNKAGNYDVVKMEDATDKLGADLATLDAKRAKEYGVTGGVVVKKIKKDGAFETQSRMKDGFVILKINDKPVSSLEELKTMLSNSKDVTVSGFYPGYDGLYEYPFTLD
jgi:serine protease Do